MVKLPKRTKDITGMQFGSLTAVSFSHLNDRQAHWLYKCACGKEHIARSNTITYQAKKLNDPELPSCGCVELVRKTKHGFRTVKNTHPAYKAFRGMLDRCYNPKGNGYSWYGAIGVTVCDEWKGNPEAFIKWSLNNGWKEGLHIDKDILCKEKGIFPHIYSPETCQWVTPKVNVGFSTDRGNYGRHPNVRLSHAEVAELLDTYLSEEVTDKRELARMFGLLSVSSVDRLLKLSGIGVA